MYAAFLNLATAQAVTAMGYWAEGTRQGGQLSRILFREPMRQNRGSYCASLALVGILTCSFLFLSLHAVTYSLM